MNPELLQVMQEEDVVKFEEKSFDVVLGNL